MSSVFFLSFGISETKHVIKKLTTHVTVTSEVFINKSINIHCCFPLNNLYIFAAHAADYFLIPTLTYKLLYWKYISSCSKIYITKINYENLISTRLSIVTLTIKFIFEQAILRDC